MDAMVNEMSKAYEELVAAAKAAAEAEEQPAGGENTAAAKDAASEALRQRLDLFHAACDNAEGLVDSIRRRYVGFVDGDNGSSAASSSSSSSSSSPPSSVSPCATLALPDDAIRRILLYLPSAASAARASLVSRCWRNAWATLPELRFHDVTDLARVSAALRLRVAPVHLLHIESNDPAPEKIAAAGVFAKLTVLRLSHFRLDRQNQRDLGGAVSSEGCPSLQQLFLSKSHVSSDLAIRSESLLCVRLLDLQGLERLKVVAPMLKELGVFRCFNVTLPIADISAPAVEDLQWIGVFDRLLVQFGVMPRLWRLAVWGLLYIPSTIQHLQSLSLLKHFVAARHVHLTLVYPPGMVNYVLLVKAVKMLPAVEIFSLILRIRRHAFGPCLFHLLKMCTGIRELNLDFDDRDRIKAEQIPCSYGCTCHEPHDWETMDIRLNFLQKVEINNMSGADCKIFFVNRLLRWVPMLKTITLTFDHSVPVSKEVLPNINRLINFRQAKGFLMTSEMATRCLLFPADQASRAHSCFLPTLNSGIILNIHA
uniref:F-box domain-containing protein n=1 Tax=Oryza brachyantha TaxID=4533 RepID=J3MJJ8_ORYBR